MAAESAPILLDQLVQAVTADALRAIDAEAASPAFTSFQGVAACARPDIGPLSQGPTSPAPGDFSLFKGGQKCP